MIPPEAATRSNAAPLHLAPEGRIVVAARAVTRAPLGGETRERPVATVSIVARTLVLRETGGGAARGAEPPTVDTDRAMADLTLDIAAGLGGTVAAACGGDAVAAPIR